MVKPLFDRILVKEIKDEEEQTKGRIFIPQTAKDFPRKGTVVAVGPGRYEATATLVTRPMSVREGQVVYFGKFTGAPIQVAGEEHLIIVEGDILAVED